LGPRRVVDRSRVARDDGSPCPAIGRKLAEGRDSEIFEHGPGKVLRVARDGHSLVAEAEVMRYGRSLGRVDKAAARRAIPAAVEHRLSDRNMSTEERTRMREFATWAANP